MNQLSIECTAKVRRLCETMVDLMKAENHYPEETAIRMSLCADGMPAHTDSCTRMTQFDETMKSLTKRIDQLINECCLADLSEIAGESVFALQPTNKCSLLVTQTRILGGITTGARNGAVTINIVGMRVVVEKLIESFDRVCPANDVPDVLRLRRMAHSGMLTHYREPMSLREPLEEPQAYYPTINFTPEQMWEAFNKAEGRVMLMMGPVGTGKSGYLMEMLRARGWGKETLLVDNTEILLDPKLPDVIRDATRGAVVVIEDADAILGRRADGNHQMQALLNATAGLIRSDVKIIITTNLTTTDRIDEALLRPGRTFKVLNFPPLTIEQAYRVRQVHGLPEVNLEAHGWKTLTLAEALNYEESKERAPTARVGFVRN